MIAPPRSWTLISLPATPAPANSGTKNLLVVETPPEKDWWVKISDFGISKRSTDENQKYSTVIGTHEYMAPELRLCGEGDKASYTVAADMWSLGALCVRLLTSKPAFNPRELAEYYLQNQAFGPENALASNGMSQDGRDFIREIMARVPQNRLSAQEATKHRWITLTHRPSIGITEPTRYVSGWLPNNRKYIVAVTDHLV